MTGPVSKGEGSAEKRPEGDVILLSPAGTHGWRANELELSASLERLDIPHRVIRTAPERGRRLLRIWMLGAPLVALAARRALKQALEEQPPRAVISVNSTAALLLPRRRLRSLGVPVVVRIDSPARELWPGPAHVLQRLLERRALRRARATLTTGPASTEAVDGLAARPVEVPVPVPRVTVGGPRLERAAIAYAAQPFEKGADRVCQAWVELERRLGRAEPIRIVGVEAEEGRTFISRLRVSEPQGAIWIGALPRDQYLELLPGSAAFISAPRFEGHGIAQLEALAAGVPLVTAPAPGAYEAERIARELVPELVSPTPDARGLADAIEAALALSEAQRREYAERARELLRPFTTEHADAALRGALSEIGVAPVGAGGR